MHFPRMIDYWGLVFLALLLILTFSTQAAYPPQADLSVSKEASIEGNVALEVHPGEAFDYVITVSNKDPLRPAVMVVVTDKLPYEVALRSINVSSSLGSNTVEMSGDLIYVRLDEIPANRTGRIVISVTAPEQAPTTLYNVANIRYANDPNQSNNRATVSTYVPLLGYDRLGA